MLAGASAFGAGARGGYPWEPNRPVADFAPRRVAIGHGAAWEPIRIVFD